MKKHELLLTIWNNQLIELCAFILEHNAIIFCFLFWTIPIFKKKDLNIDLIIIITRPLEGRKITKIIKTVKLGKSSKKIFKKLKQKIDWTNWPKIHGSWSVVLKCRELRGGWRQNSQMQ